MSINGRFEDVPVADVFTMLHFAGRSGELTLESGERRARLVLRAGAITTASCPALGRTLGQILSEQAGVPQEAIVRALEAQRESKLPLGRILTELGVVSREALSSAMAALIREIMAEVLTWRSGRFSFLVTATPQLDEVAVVPDGVALESGIDVKELLSDAQRVFDEHAGKRQTGIRSMLPGQSVEPPKAAPPHEPRSADPEPVEAQRAVVLVTDDGIVANTLRSTFAELGMVVRTYALEQEAARQTAELLADGADVVTVLHADGMGVRADERTVVSVARRFKAAFPRMPLIVVGQLQTEARHELARCGVRALIALPSRGKGPTDFRAALAEASAELSATVTGAFVELAGSESFVDGSTRDLKRLCERLEGLQRSTERTQVALALLEYVAENVERAVLFLARKRDVMAVSAFGEAVDGSAMSDSVPGLVLRPDDATIISAVVEQGRTTRAVVSSDGAECAPLFRRIGRPRSGAALWIPVRSVERVFAVLYADNGSRMRPLVSSEALQILACHAGLMLENMALQRRASRASEPGSGNPSMNVPG